MAIIDIQIIAYGLLGLALVYWAKKRRFDRTTIYGTEQFQSYKHKAGAKLGCPALGSWCWWTTERHPADLYGIRPCLGLPNAATGSGIVV